MVTNFWYCRIYAGRGSPPHYVLQDIGHGALYAFVILNQKKRLR